LAEWFAFELTTGILPIVGDSFLGTSILDDQTLGRASDALNETPVRAGVIKLAASNEGLQPVEAKALQAAVIAAQSTGAAIVSHCPSGEAFQQQLDVLERAGGDPSRFVQVHAHAEPRFDLHRRALERGAWLEYDAIGGQDDVRFIDLIKQILDAGKERQLLLSQDVVGWRAAVPGGGNVDERGAPKRRYAYVVTAFLPRLRAAGVSEATIRLLTVENPRRLLALG
jgi:phosphotriesterase-related protein